MDLIPIAHSTSDGSDPLLPRTGTRAYQPSDLNLTTLTRPRLDLILSVGLRSGGRGVLGARVAAGVAGDDSPRRRYAGDGQSWPSGLHPGRGQAREDAGGTCNAPERSAWWIGAQVGDPHGEGDSGHGGKVKAHAEGERGNKNERGVFLTTPGCCNGN
jgi:hypothetical protein